MGRLCGGAHEISGIPAPLWLCELVVERIMGWVGGWVVVVWVVVGVNGWVGGGDVGGGGGGCVCGWWQCR